MKPTLLFLSAHLPGPNPPQAGHKTAYRDLVWLAEKYQIHLLTFASEADGVPAWDCLSHLCQSVVLIQVSSKTRIASFLQKPWLPLFVAVRWSSQAAEWLRHKTATLNPTRVHSEWTQLAQYFPIYNTVKEKSLNVHDVLHQVAVRRSGNGLLSPLWRLESCRIKRWEARAYSGFDAVFAPTSKDVKLVKSIGKKLDQRVRRLSPPFGIYRPSKPRDYAEPLVLLFWGALNRAENAEGARWLIHRLLPLLRRHTSSCKLVIAGANPPRDLLASSRDGIEVTGFLDDPAPCFWRSHLAVLPLRIGAGVKVKVLECLASGLPVITTTVGAEGIDAAEHDGLIVVPLEENAFISGIRALLSSPARLPLLSSAAIRWSQCQTAEGQQVLLDI